MGEEYDGNTRHEVVWSKAALELVRANRHAVGAELSALVSKLVEETGNPRWACRRFVRRLGVRAKRLQRNWTEAERKRLLELIELRPVSDVARLLGRSPDSIWHMLRRLGASTKMGKDGFTKYQLAESLHVRPERVQGWIERCWLRIRNIKSGAAGQEIICAEDFCQFCKEHAKDVIGQRLKFARLEFVRLYVFPPSHAESLPVRASKKERAAYEEQLKEVVGYEPRGVSKEDEDAEDIDLTA